MEQEYIRQQLTKAFGIAPMAIGVLIGIEEDGIHPRIGDVFYEVLNNPRYQEHFNQGFMLANIDSSDMETLMQGGLDQLSATLELAALAIQQLTDSPEESLYIKLRLFEFAEDLALRLENRPEGDGEQLGELYQAKLHYLGHQLKLREDMQPQA